MPDAIDSPQFAPFVRETLDERSMYFSLSETQSRMRLATPDALVLEYTRTMMAFLMFVPRPRHIAMIGLGGGSLAKFCRRHLPGARMTVVEINPQVIALRGDFGIPPDGPRFRVLQGDGAQFVRDTDERVDVLLVDGFDRGGQPPALCTQRFYDDCVDMLTPQGVLVVNLHTGDALFDACLQRIARSADSEPVVVHDADHGNSVVFAGRRQALRRQPTGPLRAPAGLDADAWTQLMPAFARVASALHSR